MWERYGQQLTTSDWIYWLGPALGATIAAGFYKMLKWLQYETVLGPEDGDVVPRPEDVGRRRASHVDEEKAVEGQGKQGAMVITGPGLGDLLTEGPQDAVSGISLSRSSSH